MHVEGPNYFQLDIALILLLGGNKFCGGPLVFVWVEMKVAHELIKYQYANFKMIRCSQK